MSSDTIDLTHPEAYKKVMAAIAQQGEIKPAGTLTADAAESLGLKSDATPAEIVVPCRSARSRRLRHTGCCAPLL